MSLSAVVFRSFEPIEESRKERPAAASQDCLPAPWPAESTAATEQGAEARGDSIVVDRVNTTDTRARALKALDTNRNRRQIAVLLTFRGGKLLEESQSLVQQYIQFRELFHATYERVVSRSFSLFASRRGDPNGA